ncbi:MAG: hypothetical protein AB9903_28320 [Vulcanimicrobiota bacterium]
MSQKRSTEAIQTLQGDKPAVFGKNLINGTSPELCKSMAGRFYALCRNNYGGNHNESNK